MKEQILSRKFLLLTLLLSLSCLNHLAWAKNQVAIPTSGTCDGLPRLPVATLNGFCLGLVAQGFSFTRGVLPIDGNQVLVIDMGGWGERKGSLWRVYKGPVRYKKVLLLSGLDRPHAIVKSPRGLIYIASVDKVSLLDQTSSTARLIDVIGGSSNIPPLPTSGRHPLKQLVFDEKGNLLVNIGSASDNCEQSNKKKELKKVLCEEAEGIDQRGAIRKYHVKPDGSLNPQWEVYASGLRNSMGLAFEPIKNTLWQVENARDSISKHDPSLDDAALPHDELNLIDQGANYGWPYCYDMGVSSPEYPNHDCKKYRRPEVLLPPHSAPLGMAFHDGRGLPNAIGKGLFVTLHGYRDTGHRIIFIPFGSDGKPSNGFIDIVSGWDETNGLTKGSPVDIRKADDGSLFISEDRNGTLLRLSYDRY